MDIKRTSERLHSWGGRNRVPEIIFWAVNNSSSGHITGRNGLDFVANSRSGFD